MKEKVTIVFLILMIIFAIIDVMALLLNFFPIVIAASTLLIFSLIGIAVLLFL